MTKKLQKTSLEFLLKNNIFLIVVLVLFIGVRLIYLPESIGFGSDEGRDFLAVWQMYTTKHISLIGPPSEYSVNGRQFFFGPAPYYLIFPALVIGNWDPLAVSYFLILLNAVVLIIALASINRYIKDKVILFLFAVFSIFTPIMIEDTRSYWNPYFMLPVSTLLLALFVATRFQSKTSKMLFVMIGFLFGLGLQFHYSFIFAIILGGLWLFFTKKLHLAAVIYLIVGFVVGFLPLIIFELRNHFYNFNTFLLVFSGSGNAHGRFTWNIFYFLSLLPFGLFITSVLLARLQKHFSLIIYSLVGTYILWSLVVIVTVPNKELNYPALQELAKVIETDKPMQFNIVDQLTSDNRAVALRYLLTVHGVPPMGVSNYPQAKTLYIYTKIPLNTLLLHPVWEIASAEPFSTVKVWKLHDTIDLYRLEK